MRKLLPLLLVLLLLSLLTAAASAHALSVPELPGDPPAAVEDEAEEPETEEADDPDTEEDGCTIEDEEDVQLCAEIAEEERESEEAEECVIEDATAKLVPRPSSDTVELTIHYESFAPVAAVVEAHLRGSKGKLRLGADHAHLRRAGVYRKSFVLGEKKMDRALTAREFEVELRAVNTPRYCRLELNGAPRRAKRSLRAGAPGRSGDRGRTPGKSAPARLR
jgi:hypothetical protein